MSKFLALEQRLSKLDEKLKVLEAKQVGIIYHVCTLDSYLKFIEPNDQLTASGKYTNQIYGDSNFVSFTRDKYFVVGTKSVQQSKVLIQLVIDGDKLSEHYKVAPYNDFAFDANGHSISDIPKYREKEEGVKGPIKNLSKYIKEIRVDSFDMDSSTLAKMRKAKLAEKGVKYFHFIKGFQDKAFYAYRKEKGIKDGMPLADVMGLFKDYINLGKFNDLLFSYDEDEIAKAIKGKANLNIKYPSGYVLEEYAQDDSMSDIVELLISKGADVNLKMTNNLTAIMYAAQYDSPKNIGILVENGAKIDEPNDEGYTPLMLAIKENALKSVAELLKLGAKTDVPVPDDGSLVGLTKNKKMLALLKKSGVK